MNRRSFVISTASAVSLGALGLTPFRLVAASTTDSLVARLTAANDALIPDLLRRQNAAGAVTDAHGIKTVHDTSRLIAVLVAARHAPGSRYHRDDALIEPLERAAAYMLSAQHADARGLFRSRAQATPGTANQWHRAPLARTPY